MNLDGDRVILATIVALLVFSIAYVAVASLTYVALPDNWGTEDYAAYSEYAAEQATTIVEILIPGLLGALVYRLIRGNNDGTLDK